MSSPNTSEATLCVSANFMFKDHRSGKHKTQRCKNIDLEKLPPRPTINTMMGMIRLRKESTEIWGT